MEKLKNTLVQALEGDERATVRLCNHCRRVAVAYLRTKVKHDDFLLQHLYSSVDDLALDCIADLFGRKGNSLFQIEEYMDRAECSVMTEPEVVSKIRRLIFSKVNEGLFKNYRSFDPSLSKIIRNLKRTLEEGKVEGGVYDSNTGEIEFVDFIRIQKPNITDEILEIRLSGRLSEISNSVEAVYQLKSILEFEVGYSAKLSLVNFAIVLRKSFARRLNIKEDIVYQKSDLRADEINEFIEQSIIELKPQLFSTYVDSDKLHPIHFEKYLQAVKDILESDFVKKSPKEGYFEHFEFYFPEVSYGRYREEHRTRLEYLVRKVREFLVSELKREEYFSRFRRW
ncbi:hypothetical protein [Gracilimonas mengyeensis]|uniref:Uncharacterized protein n=1 Tax=Gracilimonas mengyeensis TaxID=1302730 RepID=A0A521BU45_9BACT|nr:hypothetical protein [Gracilimonas mengyeensis]SMO50676.1 hypothetical protein SAMN06265219_10396 [Gracilimonas mengyeensis]